MKNSSSLATGLLASLLLFISSNSRAQSLTINPELERSFALRINHPDTCEAYPYLSADGLRLYFTSNREGGFGRIYFCSRNSVRENFNTPVIVGKNITDGYFCSTLTADELTMYMANKGEIYVSKRKNLQVEFSKPEIIKGLINGYKFAPAISPNGNELILVKDLSGNKYQTIIYKKTGEDNFSRSGALTHPEGELSGGQFSKDGLSYYTAYKTFDSTKTDIPDQFENIKLRLVKYTRKSLGDAFERIENLSQAANPAKRNHQPTVNEDGSIMVIVNTEKYEWRYNELRLINFNKEDIVDSVFVLYDCALGIEKISEERHILVDTVFCKFPTIQCGEQKIEIVYEDEYILTDIITELASSVSTSIPEIISHVKIYPNPFTSNIIVTLEKNDINSNFELFDIAGRKIMTSKLNNSVNRIQFNKPGGGIYIYRLTNSKGKVFATGKLVRK